MPCMCGDLYCWSCGPAQGNFRCDICGKWTEDGGCDDPDACAKTAKALADEYYRQLCEEERLAEEWKEDKP